MKQNSKLNRKILTLIVLFMFSCSLTLSFFPLAKAQATYTITVAPTGYGASTIIVVDNTNGTISNYTSFPFTYVYTEGDSISFTAIAGTGYTFNYWIDDGVYYYTNPYTNNYYTDVTLQVAFTRTPSSLTVLAADPYGAYGYYEWTNYTRFTPGTFTFEAGTSEIVRAYSDYYIFSYWLINGNPLTYGYYDSHTYAEFSFLYFNFTGSTYSIQAVFRGPPPIPTPEPTSTTTPEPGSQVHIGINWYRPPYGNVTWDPIGTYDPVHDSYWFDYGTTVTFTATEDEGYVFSAWYVDGALYSSNPLPLAVYSNITDLHANFSPLVNNFYFLGPFDETTGLAIDKNVTVWVYSTTLGVPNANFTLNGASAYNSSAFIVSHFMFDLGNYTREYWLQPTETSGVIYVFDDNIIDYTINFLDMSGGYLTRNPYVVAKYYVNGTLFTMEKRLVDSQKSFQMDLVTGRTYTLYLEGLDGERLYGDLLMTGITGVQLSLRGVEFPTDASSFQQFKYIHAWAVRDYLTPTDVITTSYEDLTNATTSVSIVIRTEAGIIATAYVETVSPNQFNYVWIAADTNTTYTVTISSEPNGYEWTYILRKGSENTSPWDLSAFGSISGVQTASFIPALIIVGVAACFSEVTAEVAMIVTCIIALLLSVLGWISISSGMLVAAFAFSVLASVVAVRRRR